MVTTSTLSSKGFLRIAAHRLSIMVMVCSQLDVLLQKVMVTTSTLVKGFLHA